MSEEIEQVVPDTNKNTVESLMNAMGSLGGDNPYLNELKQIRTETAEENKEVIAPTNEDQNLPPDPNEGGGKIENKEEIETNPIFGDKNLAVKTEVKDPVETPKELSDVITKFGVKDLGEFEQKVEGWKQIEEST